MFIKLAIKSLLNRKGSVALTIIAMSVSIFVLLGVEHIRLQAKSSFSNTVSGVDLIVGAKTGRLNLLLYSVFRIGSATNNIQWQSFERIAANPNVKWAIPMSLGDSHKGHRVLGTNSDYFQHFSYGNQHVLEFSQGQAFNDLFDVVLGSEVAKKLGYKPGDKLTLAHGMSSTSFSKHDEYPFTVVGILSATGTPVDQTLHVSLQGLEAIHIGWQQGVKLPGANISQEQLKQTQSKLKPKQITAIMLGLKSKMTTFYVQRAINNDSHEPLLAILPGVALSELWQIMAIMENTLRLVALLVLIAALLGLSAMLLASIRERSNEIHLLRVIGAPPGFLFLFIELEALLVSFLSSIFGAGILYVSLLAGKSFISNQFGLHIETNIFSMQSFYYLLIILLATMLAAAIPALEIYKGARQFK